MAGEAVLENPDVIVGCDAIVVFNGIVAGFAKDIDLDENLNQAPVEAIGAWKPRGFKSLKWDGTMNCTFHILAVKVQGLIPIDTSSPVAASAGYTFLFKQKSTGKRIASGVAHINTRNFGLSNNDLSNQRISFVLRDLKMQEAFN